MFIRKCSVFLDATFHTPTVILHLEKLYNIELLGTRIGTTMFESADTPMGVLHGKINFDNIESGYNFFSQYCKTHGVEINTDYPEDKFIDTAIIPDLKIFRPDRTELSGWGAYVTGMDSDSFEIALGGISSEIIRTEFKQHYDEYYGSE